jgi:hypothetical protein
MINLIQQEGPSMSGEEKFTKKKDTVRKRLFGYTLIMKGIGCLPRCMWQEAKKKGSLQGPLFYFPFTDIAKMIDGELIKSQIC